MLGQATFENGMRSIRSRKGNPRRRKLEYLAVANQVRKNKDRLIARIQRYTKVQDGHAFWTGAKSKGNNYPVISFMYKGEHVKITVTRVVLILKLKKPIPLGIDAGHTCVHSLCIAHIEPQHYTINANYQPTLL